MLDSRKLFLATALILVLSSAAFAQVPLSCVAQAAGTPSIRSSGVTELVGDVIIRCTGGTSTPAGQAVPQTNFQVFTQPAINITSRILGDTGGNWTEALMFIDEPLPANQALCGSANQPEFSSTVPGVCSIVAPTNIGLGTYDGGLSRPNAWQGRLIGDKSLIWQGIPFDPPGTGPERRIRITNVRVNVSDLGVTGPVAIGLLVSTSPSGIGNPISVPITNPNPTVAIAQPDLDFGFDDADFLQCESENKDTVDDNDPPSSHGSITFEEKFPTVFRRKRPYDSTTAADKINNDILGTIFDTESGFYKTSPQNASNWGLPSGRGSATAFGLADTATRLGLRFTGIPAGVELWLDTTGAITGGLTGTSGRLDLVNTNVVETAGTWSRLDVVGGTAQATYEVAGSTTLPGGPDTNAFEETVIRWAAAFKAQTQNNLPGLGTATIQGSLAPISSAATASKTSNIPRFKDTSDPEDLFSIAPCATNLLFPYVTNAAGFDTGLAISNTSHDPFDNDNIQTGACTINYYGKIGNSTVGVGTQDPLKYNSPSITGGEHFVWTLSSGGAVQATAGFQGYIIAQCKFQYAHGFAFISDLGIQKFAMGYLALVMDEWDPEDSRSGSKSEKLGQ